MRVSEAGQSRLKGFFTLAVLAALIYVGFRALPVYVNNYQLEDYTRQLAVQATVSHTSADEIQQNVVARASDLSLPVSPEQVTVVSNRAGVEIAIDYTVPVDLRVYTWVLHFRYSTSNRALT